MTVFSSHSLSAVPVINFTSKLSPVRLQSFSAKFGFILLAHSGTDTRFALIVLNSVD